MIKKMLKLILGVLISLLLIGVAIDNRIIKRNYVINTSKIKTDFKIIQISDLHSCVYGDNQEKIIDILEEEKPDFIVLSGDILDDKMDEEPVFTLLGQIGDRFECFYSTGNHEIWTNDIDRVKNDFRNYGIKVLAGDREEININGETVDIFGVDDPEIGDKEFFRQFVNIHTAVDEKRFSVLISHRPELVDLYEAFKGDLILSGHAHGGQWRIPFLLNGLVAPNQGIFPKYAGGLYNNIGSGKMIVSRGLSKENTIVPRIFNRPEIVVIDIKGN